MKNPNFNSPDWLLNQNLKYNAATFAAFKAHQEGSEIQKLLYDPETDGIRKWTDFRDRALGVSERYNKRWLQTEYNHAAQASRQARKWQDFQSTKELYPNLKYVAVKDARTRHEHRELDGAIYPIDDPFWDTYMPPNGWGCRCTARPTDAGPRKAKGLPTNPKGFNNNPGKSGQVFPEDSAYFRKGIDKLVFNQVNKVVRPPELVQKHYKEYQGYGKEYEKAGFNQENGGYAVYHNKHQFDKHNGPWEKKAAQALKNNGYRVSLDDETPTGNKLPDGQLNGELFEIKTIRGRGSNAIKRNIELSARTGVKTTVLIFPKKPANATLIYDGFNKWEGVAKKEKLQKQRILYIIEDNIHFYE